MHIPTIEEVIQPYTHLPKTIQQAILRIETHPSFSVLTKASRASIAADHRKGRQDECLRSSQG
jgi:hypothetical protein